MMYIFHIIQLAAQHPDQRLQNTTQMNDAISLQQFVKLMWDIHIQLKVLYSGCI